MAGKFDLKKSPRGKFMFNLKSGNGQVILTSELYETKKAAENGINSVRKNAGNPKRFETKAAKNGKGYFVLKASNGQVIGKSQFYKGEAGLKNGIASVARNAADAAIADSTGA
jgi:uncharacterized protein YegP (UPF0339 family)